LVKLPTPNTRNCKTVHRSQTASTSHITNDKDFLSARVSFKLNLRGPSFTIQSACSSSLVAVHLACQTLRVNECNMMLAGGLVVRVPQVRGYLAEKRSLHSLDGHCRPFNSVGQGTILLAASEPYCSSPWNKRCQIAITFLRLSNCGE
jgi:acyl transferase domain-containing protein